MLSASLGYRVTDRLTVNLVLMKLRKKARRTSARDDPGPDSEDSRPMEIGSPDSTLIGSADRLTLEKVIEALPPGYRIIFQLHDIEGYEHREIAGMIGCSVGNSKSQLHKARMKLREMLQVKPAASEEAG